MLDKREVPDLYRLRWKIELLFKYFKTNGYNLEDLRITDLNKIRLIITLLTLACIFTILVGKDREKEKPTKQKSMRMDELLMLFRFLKEVSLF